MLQPSTVFGHLAASLADDWSLKARPEQLPPLGDWHTWLLLDGRGFGKSRTGAETIQKWVLTGHASRIALVAPTAADARDVMVEGPSGLASIAPNHFRPVYQPSLRRLEWPNGAIATTFSAEEADRLRGPEHDTAWCDELGAWKEADNAFAMLKFGLRRGWARTIITTTPRPIKLVKELLALEGKGVVVTRGRTMDNASNLSRSFLDTIQARYAGTRLGRQELDAELLEDVQGALWSRDQIDRNRVQRAPDLQRIVVSIDPAVSNNEGSDETGIIVAGIDRDDHGYLLADYSGRYSPIEWARKAVHAYQTWQADRIVAEINQGGAMVESTLRMVDAKVPYSAVHASRGKVTRAEPVSALYEQNRIHHVGAFSELEDQLCSFTSDFNRGSMGSPDRLDALVWAFTELIVEGRPKYRMLEVV
ncbi:MAG TPA: terminase family protein [Beijerinckiaceae bacterium]|jgi:phage terminase large subunit-like protein|nr:terminase family protein [Beijerinckiaceae bacterium]